MNIIISLLACVYMDFIQTYIYIYTIIHIHTYIVCVPSQKQPVEYAHLTTAVMSHKSTKYASDEILKDTGRPLIPSPLPGTLTMTLLPELQNGCYAPLNSTMKPNM